MRINPWEGWRKALGQNRSQLAVSEQALNCHFPKQLEKKCTGRSVLWAMAWQPQSVSMWQHHVKNNTIKAADSMYRNQQIQWDKEKLECKMSVVSLYDFWQLCFFAPSKWLIFLFVWVFFFSCCLFGSVLFCLYFLIHFSGRYLHFSDLLTHIENSEIHAIFVIFRPGMRSSSRWEIYLWYYDGDSFSFLAFGSAKSLLIFAMKYLFEGYSYIGVWLCNIKGANILTA